MFTIVNLRQKPPNLLKTVFILRSTEILAIFYEGFKSNIIHLGESGCFFYYQRKTVACITVNASFMNFITN